MPVDYSWSCDARATSPVPTMTHTIEISDDLRQRIEDHLREDESYEEFITELVSMYETEGAFLREGYSE